MSLANSPIGQFQWVKRVEGDKNGNEKREKRKNLSLFLYIAYDG